MEKEATLIESFEYNNCEYRFWIFNGYDRYYRTVFCSSNKDFCNPLTATGDEISSGVITASEFAKARNERYSLA